MYWWTAASSSATARFNKSMLRCLFTKNRSSCCQCTAAGRPGSRGPVFCFRQLARRRVSPGLPWAAGSGPPARDGGINREYQNLFPSPLKHRYQWEISRQAYIQASFQPIE